MNNLYTFRKTYWSNLWKLFCSFLCCIPRILRSHIFIWEPQTMPIKLQKIQGQAQLHSWWFCLWIHQVSFKARSRQYHITKEIYESFETKDSFSLFAVKERGSKRSILCLTRLGLHSWKISLWKSHAEMVIEQLWQRIESVPQALELKPILLLLFILLPCLWKEARFWDEILKGIVWG